MVRLIFNATVRAEGPGLDGFYRVVAVPLGESFVWLAFVAPREAHDQATPNESATAPGTVTRACRDLLRSMEESGSLAEVTLEDPGTLARAEQMKAPRKLQWDARCTALARLLDHDAICESLQKKGRLGPLVRAVSVGSGLHRATVYRMWIQLCQRGFTNFGRCPSISGAARPAWRDRSMSFAAKQAGSRTRFDRARWSASCSAASPPTIGTSFSAATCDKSNPGRPGRPSIARWSKRSTSPSTT